MRRPSLETFRFFEVASRQLNFTAAGAELYVTHGAVSQRIKALEAYIGVPLFERRGRSMTLTPQGRELRLRIATALHDIDRAVEAIRPDHPARALTISVLPVFATRWLIPRLTRFNDLHPDIGINIRAGQALIEFDRDDVDLAVRFGNGSWPNLQIEKLFDEELFPVCSPSFPGLSALKKPSDLLAAKLLHDTRQPWSIWFNAIGLKMPQPMPGLTYIDSNLLLDAALAGHGIALGRASLAAPELDAGRLIRLFNKAVQTNASHYLVHAIGADERDNVAKFKAWILSEARLDVQQRSH